jgi:PAS domain S-box-containing protein
MLRKNGGGGQEPPDNPKSESFTPQRTEPLLREAADSTPAPVWMTNSAGAVEFMNRAFSELTGISSEEALGDAWLTVLHPDDLAAVREKRAAAWAAGHVPYSFEARFRRRDGVWRWFEVSSKPRVDANGQFQGYVGLAVDRTEARAAQEALRESEARLRLAVDAGRMGVWEWDIAAGSVKWSAELEALHGLSPGAFPGTFEAFQSDMHPQDRDRVIEAIQKTLKDGRSHEIEYRIVRPDGSMRWVEGRGKLFHDDAGRPVRMVGVCADITARKQADETLRASEERYRAVVESQPDLVCRFRPDGVILFVNSAYARARGMTVEALTGANLWAWVSKEDQPAVRAMLDGLSPQKPEVRIENRFQTADGERWMLWTNRALAFDESGRWTEAQSTGVDIHDRKTAEEHTKLLIDELNHRVKNTLAVVQGIARQSFKRGNVDPAAVRAFEDRIGALAIAHSLLTRTHWTPAPLHDVVRGVIALCGRAQERVGAEGEPVMLTPRQALSLTMILHELCTNALKYGALSTDEGGVALSWSVTGDDPQRLELSWRERNGPRVQPPKQRGYGSTMIERAFAHDTGGEAKLTFAPSGLQCAISVPLDS